MALDILARYPTLSAGVSGNILSIIDEQRIMIEDRTGLSVGSPTFADRFKPAMIALSAAKALHASSAADGDAARLALGDFEIWKGSDSTFNVAASAEEKSGNEALRRLGVKMNFQRVIGGG